MKKVVFLFVLIAIAFSATITQVKASSFDLGDYEIVITSISDENQRGFTIEKTGVNPFYNTVTNMGEYDYITGVVELNQYLILYGYCFSTGSDTQYDSLVYIYDLMGNQMSKHILDFGEVEAIENVFFMDDVLILQTEQNIDSPYSHSFSANYFTALDADLNIFEDVKISSEISEIINNDRYLLIRHDQSSYFNQAIRSDLSVFSVDDDLDLMDRGVYTQEFYLEFINEGELNGELVSHGILIDYPGSYSFKYHGKTYDFVLTAPIYGVENNKVYLEGVVPRIEHGNILVNNDLYITGTTISEPGNYDLVVEGVGDYAEAIHFVIAHSLTGIINNQTYDKELLLTFTGDGYLNNQYIQSPYEVIEPGDYVLKIKGVNDYLETYYFQIETEDSSLTIVDFIQKFDIVILVIVIISGIIVLKKK